MSVGKGALAVSLTCASGVGGTFIYRAAVPGSWKDVLVRGGYKFLETLNEFEAVYKEHKIELIDKNATFKASLGNNDATAHSRLKTWCLSELQTTYTGEEEDRDRLVKLCTTDGIISVKARLTSNKKHSFIEDETETEQDKKYKVVFAVYRYSEAFTTWLKGMVGGEETEFSQSTQINDGYPKLKQICQTELKRPYKEKADPDYYKNLSWWCQKVNYDTFETLAKYRNKDWVTDEDSAAGKGEKWTYTEQVKTEIKGDVVAAGGPAGSAQQQQENLKDEDVKKWCKENKDKSLDEEGNYQDKFKIFLSVCKK